MHIVGPVLMAVLSIAALLGVMVLVRRHATARGWNAEVQRKLIHVATGLFALLLPVLFADDWAVYLLLGLTMLVMAAIRLPAFRNAAAGAALHGVERTSYGDFLLAIGVGLVFLLSDRDPLLYALPILVLTLGDAAAALAGSTYGRRFFAVEDGRKSVEGSAMLFLVTLVLSMMCLLLLSQIARPNVVVLSLMIAAFATLVEADSWRGFDNLFLPLGILIVLREHGTTSPLGLLALLVVFVSALVVFHALADRLGVSRHTARVYLVAIFLLLSITALQNVVFPLAVLVLHVVAERRAPTGDRHPELDAVAALAIVSFGWLAIGNATGLNALDFFGVTTAGLCLSLAALALSNAPLVLRVLVLVFLAGGLVPVWQGLMRMNPGQVHWTDGLLWVYALSAGLCALWPSLRAGAFKRRRMAKLLGLAAALPLVAYAVLAIEFQGTWS